MKGGGGQKAQKGVWGPKKNFVKIGQKSVKIRPADNFKGTMHEFKPIYTNC